jgi:flavorubredoxin
MPKLKSHPETAIDEIADGIYRISTGMPGGDVPGGFSFNQYLIVDDAPLLFHTGMRGLFTNTRAAIETVMPVSRLRYLGFSHYEADECGAMNQFLAVAPKAEVVCGKIAAMVAAGDQADRPPRAMADGEKLSLGRREMIWLDAPHVPHGWDCGFMADTTTRTLFCGDLFTQAGDNNPPVTESDILEPSEMMRHAMDYFAHGPDTPRLIEKLAALNPTTLACMHGSAFKGDGAGLLRALSQRLA